MNILGLNAYHADAAACLVVDGTLIAAAEEERFVRVKHWAGLPVHAIRYCLTEGGLDIADIDRIAINRQPSAHVFRKALYAFLKRPSLSAIRDRARNAKHVHDIADQVARALGVPRRTIRAIIDRVEHHSAHLASAFFVSPYESSSVASIDGFGDFISTMTGVGVRNRLSAFDHITFPHSLGLFYLALTQYLGFPSYGDEYKMMGLAAYGKPEFLEAMRRVVVLKPEGRFALNLTYFLHHSEGISMAWDSGTPTIGRVYSDALVQLLGPPREKDETLTQRHCDVAASAQAMYEEAFFHVLNDLYRKSQNATLCLAGGCALNSVANGRITSRTPFTYVYTPPAPGDAGGAVGAAYYVWHQVLGHPRGFVMDSPNWGPHYGDDDIRRTLDRHHVNEGNGYRVLLMSDELELSRRTAEAVAAGKVIGWFQGRMEFGARALGARSILADPRREDMKDILNSRIKRRELFRPFAPSIVEEAVEEYFEDGMPSPFMTMTLRVRSEKRAMISAPTHVDGTGRLQTVNQKTQPLYWRLLKEVEARTGVPVVLNTSFNENEPIVCTPDDAVNCFLRTRMDVLVIGSYVVERARGDHSSSDQLQ